MRLTVDGKSLTQPMTVRLDPRVKTPAAALAQLAALTHTTYDAALASHAAFMDARALTSQLARVGGADADALRAQVDSLAPAQARAVRANVRRRGGGTAVSLEAASAALTAAAMAMQGADVAPTVSQVEACAKAKAQSAAVMSRWASLKTGGLASLNAKRKAAGHATVEIPR